MTKAKIDYGIDAPGVIRNLGIAGIAGLLLAIFGPGVIKMGPVLFNLHPTCWGIGVLCTGEALLMLLYVKVGKFHHRDSMLALHPWRGDEQVLDVGTGRGLLLIGAAKKLTTGHAFGIDVWNAEDLSSNAFENTQQNIALEGVTEKCTLLSEGAQKMSFADASFDVIVSNLCLHNIYDKAVRAQALQEIVRVLKPGGIAIISDYKLTSEYAKAFSAAGLSVEKNRGSWMGTFPPLTIVVARKG